VTASTRLFGVFLLLGCGVASVPASQPAEPAPARYRDGAVPPMPALLVGGGEVFLELEVTREGTVTGVKTLRATPPFTDMLVAAVKQWAFEPAMLVEPPATPGAPRTVGPAPSSVLVMAVFRPPTMMGPARGELPKDVSAPSTAIAFPSQIRPPPWPPLARSGGVVLVEAHVDGRGTVMDAEVISGSPGFDEAALDTVRGWTFLPPRAPEVPADSYVYVVLGFPTPVGLGGK
jgi:TonB family protein